MRYFTFLLFPTALIAQSAAPDQRLTQTLINEIQQLRLAIERSTLLGARTQLAIGELQLQESAVARISQQYNDMRSAGLGAASHLNQVAENVKTMEQWLSGPDYADPRKHEDLEGMIRQRKVELEGLTSAEQQRSAREGELAAQLQAAQNQVSEARTRIAEMERALDAAIQQLSKEK